MTHRGEKRDKDAWHLIGVSGTADYCWGYLHCLRSNGSRATPLNEFLNKSGYRVREITVL